MRPLNYSILQAEIKDNIVNTFGGIAVVVRLLNNNTISTFGVFTNGDAKNIDTRQNPTLTTGETGRWVLVPGVDFVNQLTNAVTTPQVGATVEWVQSGTQYKKTILSVATTAPQQGTPVMFTLGVA
jgi:hypothetical protein